MSAILLLLLDDDGEFRSVVAKALEVAGFCTVEAATVPERVECAFCDGLRQVEGVSGSRHGTGRIARETG